MTEKMINIRPSRWEDLKQFYEWELQENVKQFFSIRDGQTFEEVVRTYVASDEDPAQFLYEKLGFQHEGMLRKNCRKNGVLYDVHLMSMLAEEYEARRGKA